MNELPNESPDVANLAQLFYPNMETLGRFEMVSEESLPESDRTLLAHDGHMTESQEAYHGTNVEVRVLDRLCTDQHYARKILLVRADNALVVQYGIMRVRLKCLSEKVRHEIEEEETPLGRVLIDNNLFREVHLSKLWRIVPGEELRQIFGLPTPTEVFGRTAMINLDGEPAVELLEVVPPGRK